MHPPAPRARLSLLIRSLQLLPKLCTLSLSQLLGRGLENALEKSKAPSVNRMLLNYHIDRVSSRFIDLKNCAEWSYKYIREYEKAA